MTASVAKPSARNIYDRIKGMILDFSLYPGSRTTEGELAAMFQVSRTPVRAALQRLEAEGYLTIMSKQGCYIRDLDMESLNGYYQVRVVLEMLSLENACTFMSDKALKELAGFWDPDQPGLEKDMAPEDIESLDEGFHIALAEGGGNMALSNQLMEINTRISIVRRLDFTNNDRVVITFEEHHAICQHLIGRDLSKAQNLMRQHIKRSQDFAMNLTLLELARKRPRVSRIP